MSAAIINGVYYPDFKGIESDRFKTNGQYKGWHLDEQRRTHAKDIIQAHKNGKPSGSFIREYPEEAAKYFNEDELRRYGNDYY